MINCCIKTCNSSSQKNVEGLSFFKFPKNEALKKLWIDNIGTANIKSGGVVRICSKHFEEVCINRTLGVVRLKDNVVPTLFPFTSPSVQLRTPLSIISENIGKNSASSQVCRVCLVTGVKMYSMRQDDMKTLYEEVIGVNVSIVDKMPQALCWECSYRLLKCYRFRNQALRTHSLLNTLLETEGSITEQNVRKIDRLKNGLQSNLDLMCVKTPNYFEVKEGEDSVDEKSQNGSTIQSLDDADIKEEFSDEHVEIEKTMIDEFNDEHVEIEKTMIDEFNDEHVEIEKTIVDEFSDGHSDMEKAYSDVIDVMEDSDNHDSNFENETDNRKEDKVKKKSVKTAPKPKVKTVANKSLFTVSSLSLEEQLREIEKRKLSNNYIQSEFKCDKCFKGFLHESSFKFHMTRHTNKSGKFECEVCKLHFKGHSALKHHATGHMQKFACKLCSYVTGGVHKAKLHEAFHNGALYKCSHCEEVFSKQTTYMSHLRVKHPSDIVCKLCGNSFVSQKGLYLHNKLKHRFDEAITPEEKYRCEQCDLSFVMKEALQTHLRAKHYIDGREEGKVRRRGNDPAAVRRNKILYRRYARQRQPTEPVQCEQCDATLASPRAYYTHFRRAHPDKNRTWYPSLQRNHPCMCEVCGRMFKCLALLEDHSTAHEAGVQFKCAHCEKVFRTRYNLKVHSRARHSDHRKVFSCSVCGKNFSTRSNLQRHEFSHTGLKPYTCEVCDKTFRNTDERRTHMQYVHYKKPYPKRVRARRSAKQDVSKADCSEPWPDDVGK